MVVLDNHVLNDDFVMLPKEDLQDLETTKWAKYFILECILSSGDWRYSF